MMKKIAALLGACILAVGCLASCGSKEAPKAETAAASVEAVSESAASEEAASESVSEEGTEAVSESAEAVSEAETESASEETVECELEDGVYVVEFDTDSSMFHLNEAMDGHCNLTVKNGKMTVHISLASKNIVNLFPGLAEEAEAEGAEILEPTTDSVTYSDGSSDEVYGFDLPVPCLEEEFDCAIIGKKAKWYDHKVIVKNPVRVEE